jgi:hypothetical protein
MKNLLRASVSEVAFIRNLFPSDCFKSVSFGACCRRVRIYERAHLLAARKLARTRACALACLRARASMRLRAYSPARLQARPRACASTHAYRPSLVRAVRRKHGACARSLASAPPPRARNDLRLAPALALRTEPPPPLQLRPPPPPRPPPPRPPR